MFDWFPYRLTFARTDTPARPRRQARPRIGKRLALLVGGLATLGATGLFSLPAAAATGVPPETIPPTAGSVTATIPIAILSLTVSPSAVTYGNCTGGSSTPTALGFPNGTCHTNTVAGRITITNTGAPGHIQVQGSDAVPKKGGKSWTLCWSTCSGFGLPGAANPGPDQFREFVVGGIGQGSVELRTFPQCDLAFRFGTGPLCGSAAAGAAATESLGMTGPTSSTSPATSFTTTVTWTVVL